MGSVIYREDLERTGCNNPGCTEPACAESTAEMGVRARCHPKAQGVRVSYLKSDGVIRLRCAACNAHIHDIAVAKTPERAAVAFVQ